MNNIPEASAYSILNNISGFHRFSFSEPTKLIFVSDSLLRLLECERNELSSASAYLGFVHPSDRAAYRKFIKSLSESEKELTLRYRLIKKNGDTVYVSDSSVSSTEGGVMYADSVLSDMTDVVKRQSKVSAYCGYMRCTCEKQPRVTYINDFMRELLRFPKISPGEFDYYELFKENVFLMIPVEDRRRFSLYLNRVYTSNVPLAGDMTVMRCDGSRALLFGWISKIIGDDGKEEFQCLCIDVTDQRRITKENGTKRYIKALSDVYDQIFEFDFYSKTVKCLWERNSKLLKLVGDISLEINDAVNKWIAGLAVDEDRDRVGKFILDFCRERMYDPDEKPPHITYSIYSASGEIKSYDGIFLKLDENTSLYCMRLLSGDIQAGGDQLVKENIQEIAKSFKDGAAAFELTGNRIVPLYASDNVCKFFGYSYDEWYRLMREGVAVNELLSRGKVEQSDLSKLLSNGSAEFAYTDSNTGSKRNIKAVCTKKSNGVRYIMLYTLDSSGEESAYIRTFGYFDVFVKDRPIAFRSKKSKELLALLVDRRGGFVSSDEAISFLWEDEPASNVTLARYRKVALRLKNILEEYGISHIVETVDGKRRIRTEEVKCDLYEYLSGAPEHAQLFKGSYMTNYSWAENTLGELTMGSYR